MTVARRFGLFILCGTASAVFTLSASGQDASCPPPEPRWHTAPWWAMKAQEPVGSRQVEHEGKLWPPYARPVGPPQASCHVYHAEHYWPWPYTCVDQQCVLTMSRMQEANGWLSETTLYDYHFNPETNALTEPGKLQLKWILAYVPSAYRAVWLQQTEEPAVSQARMNSVRTMAIKIVGEANLPPIAFRTAMAPGRPAIEVDSIRRKELETFPEPRVPFESSASGAASTGAGK